MSSGRQRLTEIEDAVRQRDFAAIVADDLPLIVEEQERLCRLDFVSGAPNTSGMSLIEFEIDISTRMTLLSAACRHIIEQKQLRITTGRLAT
ncbi:MAG: hypothetical protein ABIR47_07155 [Candidatus Kapaibacterium sp.]